MKKSEQYILFALGFIILIVGIFSFIYIEEKISLKPQIIRETPSPSSPSYIVVHITGEVKRPGIYKLPLGARVYEVIKIAGGPLKDGDVNRLNLARILKDGEKIIVPKRALKANSPSFSVQSKEMDINTMDKEAFVKIPGIGEKIAERIIEYRKKYGPFQSIEDLKNVSGIGDKKLEAIKKYLSSSP